MSFLRKPDFAFVFNHKNGITTPHRYCQCLTCHLDLFAVTKMGRKHEFKGGAEVVEARGLQFSIFTFVVHNLGSTAGDETTSSEFVCLSFSLLSNVNTMRLQEC